MISSPSDPAAPLVYAPLPNHMLAWQLLGHGGPEQLAQNTRTPLPTLASSDVLIKVAASAVNNTDINTRTAWYSKGDNASDASWSGEALTFPRIQGADVCGHIVAVGSAVDPGRIGQRVLIEPCLQFANGQRLTTPWYFGSECDGGFAQYTKVDHRHAHPINSPLSDAELASFPCSYSTAENMLCRAGVQAEETVLITGASGGVGSAAVQLAKARGAKVVAITRANKAAQLKALGAERVLTREQSLVTALGNNNVDTVIDLVAGAAWPQLLDVLKPGGRYAVAGAIGGALVELDVRTLYLKDLSLLGCTVLGNGVFASLIQRIEQGQIRPLVAATYPLTQLHQAQAAFAEKHHTGKIVLTIGHEKQI
ncbi:alcohol dehydrogenase family protein [Ferrimonas pelagia]|uniref:Alcohol dehydrogenase family protein n=1 Tax=Ferrimonas pelagia TaxID=1177826 RepID=A0ABP9EVV1_9GAMM